MTSAVVVLLALVAVGYVAEAIRRAPSPASPAVAPAGAAAEAKKRAALGAIADLQEERELGKLEASDFDGAVAAYEQEALEALRELDLLHERPARDDLEAEIAAARRRIACPSCGAPRRPGTNCSRCGA